MSQEAQKQIAELKSIIFDMEDDVLAILDYIGLLQQSSIQTGSNGATRLCDIMKDHGQALKEARNSGHEIIRRLANP